MHIKATDKEAAKKVDAVLLNGKRVIMPYEANEEERWVTFYVPDLPNDPDIVSSESKVSADQDDCKSIAGFKLVTKSGKVEIILRKESDE